MEQDRKRVECLNGRTGAITITFPRGILWNINAVLIVFLTKKADAVVVWNLWRRQHTGRLCSRLHFNDAKITGRHLLSCLTRYWVRMLSQSQHGENARMITAGYARCAGQWVAFVYHWNIFYSSYIFPPFTFADMIF